MDLITLNRIFQFVLDRCSVENGIVIERRVLIGKKRNIRIVIYPNDHDPPHFHIESPDFRAKFLIEDCSLLGGRIDGKSRKLVEYFHKSNKNLIQDTWENTRPG